MTTIGEAAQAFEQAHERFKANGAFVDLGHAVYLAQQLERATVGLPDECVWGGIWRELWPRYEAMAEWWLEAEGIEMTIELDRPGEPSK